jgi:hypothetical protein
MLFLLGHGMVVGNDAFLYDEHAGKSSMTLTDLGDELRTFAEEVRQKEAAFELVSFHSCSVSSVEVAYELQGTAEYMLASQGPAFVGSWPYRNILIHIFNELASKTEPDGQASLASGEFDPHAAAKNRVDSIFDYCYDNSMDYLLAGYSFDLCLCDLSRSREVVGVPIRELSDALSRGLSDPLLRDLILLAHWRSQSYWQENYTDLYDFCLCLSRYCQDYAKSAKQPMTPAMVAADAACGKVMGSLVVGGGLVVRNEFAGPAYQYSHGLSVYFPWARPSADNPLWFGKNPAGFKPGAYGRYEFRETGWRDFLESYFDATVRKPRREEPDERAEQAALRREHELKLKQQQRALAHGRGHEEEVPDKQKEEAAQQKKMLDEDMAYHVYNEEGALNSADTLKPPKTNPYEVTGDCDCTTVKNFPRDTRALAAKGNAAKGKAAKGKAAKGKAPKCGITWASQGYSTFE